MPASFSKWNLIWTCIWLAQSAVMAFQPSNRLPLQCSSWTSSYFSNAAAQWSCISGPPRASTSPPAPGSLATLSLEVMNWQCGETCQMNDSLQAEQQLGFPAGAAAGASSLDTAAPTVSILLENQIFHYIFHISLIPQQHLLLMSAHIPFLFQFLNCRTNFRSTYLITLQVPCIPNPEAEAEAGGSSDDKDGQDGRKKKNRLVCLLLSHHLWFTSLGPLSHLLFETAISKVSLCKAFAPHFDCYQLISLWPFASFYHLFNFFDPGAPPARRSLAWLGSHAGTELLNTNLIFFEFISILFTMFLAGVGASSAPYTDTVTSTNATLTTRLSLQSFVLVFVASSTLAITLERRGLIFSIFVCPCSPLLSFRITVFTTSFLRCDIDLL